MSFENDIDGKVEKVSCGNILKRVGAAKLETFLIYQSIYKNVYAERQHNTLSFVIYNTPVISMQKIIEVENLTKKFKEITAVNNLSFHVNEGDVYGFLGQNGAGKSTTMRMLLTLIKPTSGSISIFNKALFSHREEILK